MKYLCEIKKYGFPSLSHHITLISIVLIVRCWIRLCIVSSLWSFFLRVTQEFL